MIAAMSLLFLLAAAPSPVLAPAIAEIRAKTAMPVLLPAVLPNLWWEQNGATYQIQLKLSSAKDEREQERLLVETANSVVPLR